VKLRLRSQFFEIEACLVLPFLISLSKLGSICYVVAEKEGRKEGKMSTPFSGEILSEKLSKLNNSQASIETLSHWCIYHRNEANHIVKTWDRLFSSSGKEQRVAFLYLANDIIQNSRRKGSEFVSEFWKVLPASLKDVYENSDEQGKKAVSRLVNSFCFTY
ncbi:hypothetical protein GIB67_006751, partial [Kingdonia uniflora]